MKKTDPNPLRFGSFNNKASGFSQHGHKGTTPFSINFKKIFQRESVCFIYEYGQKRPGSHQR